MHTWMPKHAIPAVWFKSLGFCKPCRSCSGCRVQTSQAPKQAVLWSLVVWNIDVEADHGSSIRGSQQTNSGPADQTYCAVCLDRGLGCLICIKTAQPMYARLRTLCFLSDVFSGMCMSESPIFTMLPPTLEYQCLRLPSRSSRCLKRQWSANLTGPARALTCPLRNFDLKGVHPVHLLREPVMPTGQNGRVVNRI